MSQKHVIEIVPTKDILSEFSFYLLRGGEYDKLISSVSSVVDRYKYSCINSEIFTDLKTACEMKGWSYNTLNRMGNAFEHDGYFIQRKPILRKGRTTY